MIGKNYLSHALKKLARIDSPDLENYVIDKASRCDLLEGLLNVLEEAIVIFDSKKTVTFHNMAFSRTCGQENEKLIGRSVDKIFESIDETQQSPFPENELNPGQSIFKEIKLNLPSPRIFACKIIPAKLGNDEDCLYIAILSDITRLKQSEETRLQSAKLGSFSLLAAGIAHEIGNPLNALGLNLQLMEKILEDKDEENSEELDSMVQTCRSEVERLDFIVKKFLKTVRPLMPEKKPCNINSILSDVIDFMSAQMRELSIDYELSLGRDVPESMMDPVYMHKAIMNIIKNAIQAISGPGGKIAVRSFLRHGLITVEIQDNGEGITDDNLARVFEPYYTTKPEGSGLGLMMTYKSIQEHDGQIGIKSSPETGTTVTISLPVRKNRERVSLPPSKETKKEKDKK